jgi:N,N'-diacetyllegionaminate synthase
MVIAEAGVNHNGSLETAERLVDAAARAGADAVKFQAFRAAELASARAPKAAYQERATGSASQREMLAALELDADAHAHLKAYAERAGIAFLSSAFDLPSVSMLTALGLPTLKVPSGQITDLPYLRAVGAAGRDVILSTGMSTLAEVEDALDVLEAAGTPRSRITLLQCSSEYPAPPEDADLRAMCSLRDVFGTRVGYSDHTEGPNVAVAAVALGAEVIEKHLTLDRDMPGPDHRASMEPDAFAGMVTALRAASASLGSPLKRPRKGELAVRDVVRKSIVASRPIAAGETFTAENLTTRRPGTGVSPMRWDEVLGRAARRSWAPDEMIEL